jgi:uncharacterized membrane protein
MLAVLLGASIFPNAPNLAAGHAFSTSAADMREYLSDERGLCLPRRNILSLFDESRSPSEQLIEIGDFLERRTRDLKSEDSHPEDLLIYYVGHGLFTRGDQAYCLAVRSTNERNEGATSIRASDLAGVIKDNAAFMRRYLILDCCFAARIYREFQSGPLEAARVQLANELPERGTALLCSSNANEPALAPQGLDHTMFSDALIQALRKGRKSCPSRLSFSELGSLIGENLRTAYPDNWVRPEVHSPDQREGDIAHIPLFPNPAHRRRVIVLPPDQQPQERREPGAEELARQKAEHESQQRKSAEAAERERLAAEKAAAEKATARRMAEQQRLGRERAEQEQLARERAKQQQLLAEWARNHGIAEPGGREGNVAGLLCYTLGWLTGLIFLIIDKRPFVRFHAAQSIVVFGGLSLLLALTGLLELFRLFLITLLVTPVAWLVLMIMAYKGKQFEVLVAAGIAKRIAGSTSV